MTAGAAYSRANPSPRYRALVEQYREMHVHGERLLNLPPEKTFNGRSLPRQAGRIKALIELYRSRSILDYGSGKGAQYWPSPFVADDGRCFGGIVEWWGVERLTCYDPGFEPFSRIPGGTFDGVISTDVLEHCPEDDVAWILDEVFGFARAFVFANVACMPARKHLPNGENTHCTVRPPDWWKARFASTGAAHPGVRWHMVAETLEPMTLGAPSVVETFAEG